MANMRFKFVSEKATTPIVAEMGHTLKEWEELVNRDDSLWDFPLDEMLDGTVNSNGDIVYWFIDGRLYETDIQNENDERFTTEEKLEDVINNCGFSEDRSAFYMAKLAHRYLQQKFFNIAIKFIQLCAENYDKHRYDGRNEQACKLSKTIMSKLSEDEYYPHDFSYIENKL